MQNRKLRSVLVCLVYRPPDIGLSCLENELMLKYVKALSLKAGDINCDLRTHKGNELRLFCNSVNATQLIDKPTRITKSSISLIDNNISVSLLSALHILKTQAHWRTNLTAFLFLSVKTAGAKSAELAHGLNNSYCPSQ